MTCAERAKAQPPAAGAVRVGQTQVQNSTNGQFLYNNNGILGSQAGGGGGSVSLTGGTGISVSPNPITGTGVITNTAPGAPPAGSAGYVQLYGTSTTFAANADFARDPSTGFVHTGDTTLLTPGSQIAQFSIASTLSAITPLDIGGMELIEKVLPSADYAGSYFGSNTVVNLPANIAHSISDVFSVNANITVATVTGAPSSAEAITASVINTGAGEVGDAFGSQADVVNSGAGIIDYASGASGEIFNTGTGTITDADGIYAQLHNTNAGGTITTGAAIHIYSAANSGTLTTNYGLLIEDQSSGASNFAISTGAGLISFGTGGSANSAVCWKADGKTLSHCTSVVGAGGGCTCP